MDVRRVAVVLFAIFFYYVDGRPAYPREAVSQRSWTGIFPRLNLEISDDINIIRRYVLPICLMTIVAFLVTIWIFCYLYAVRRRRDMQKEADLTDAVVVLKPDNEPSDSEERPDTEESMPMCKIPGCFLEDVISPSSIYVTNFQENKEELVTRLYRLYNETVFNNQLPDEMEIVWNKKLIPQSGKTRISRIDGQHYAEIELSDQVVNSAERLRSTLAHEMCHAACWVINEIKDGHGRLWQAYAKSVTDIHPELPEVTEFHNYKLPYNLHYRCTSCNNKFGCFRKLAKKERFCPQCGGRLYKLATK